jgi:hypothetical protein
VLHDLVEVAPKSVHQFGNLVPSIIIKAHVLEGFLQFR